MVLGMFELQSHGGDTYVGEGPEYPWGGLYGGQIVAQALRASAETVATDVSPHSLRAYFIRRGDHREPVRYEVDRIRDGRSFVTRRVVARQAVGAILNLEASFQRHEVSPAVQTVTMPDVPPPDELADESWTDRFARRDVPPATLRDRHLDAGNAAALDAGIAGAGRVVRWIKLADRLGDLDDPRAALDHVCWLAFMSDDVPSDSVFRAHPRYRRDKGGEHDRTSFFGASIDHTVWFHRPMRVDEWHLYDGVCHAFNQARGLAIGNIFAADGTHTATFAQEFLAREVAVPASPSSGQPDR